MFTPKHTKALRAFKVRFVPNHYVSSMVTDIRFPGGDSYRKGDVVDRFGRIRVPAELAWTKPESYWTRFL